MIKGVPRPDNLEVGVQHNNGVAKDIHVSVALYIGEDLLHSGEYEHPSIWKRSRLVVEGSNWAHSHRSELLVDPSRVGLRNRDAR